MATIAAYELVLAGYPVGMIVRGVQLLTQYIQNVGSNQLLKLCLAPSLAVRHGPPSCRQFEVCSSLHPGWNLTANAPFVSLMTRLCRW
jgi:hypothetical protein